MTIIISEVENSWGRIIYRAVGSGSDQNLISTAMRNWCIARLGAQTWFLTAAAHGWYADDNRAIYFSNELDAVAFGQYFSK